MFCERFSRQQLYDLASDIVIATISEIKKCRGRVVGCLTKNGHVPRCSHRGRPQLMTSYQFSACTTPNLLDLKSVSLSHLNLLKRQKKNLRARNTLLFIQKERGCTFSYLLQRPIQFEFMKINRQTVPVSSEIISPTDF